MGGYWITCRECKTENRFPDDYMWFDKKVKGKIHDLNQWRCKGCGLLFKKAEGKAFDKLMKEEQEKAKK